MTKITILILLISTVTSAATDYNPYEDVSNMSFEARSAEIAKLLKTKYLSLDKDNKPVINVYYVKPDRVAAELKGVESLNLDAKKRIEKYLTNKFKIMIKSNLDMFLNDYEKTSVTKESTKLEDDLGILEFQEIIANHKSPNEIQLVLKKPLGTHYVNYEFDPSKKVLKKVVKKEFEGIGSTIMTFTFDYKKVGSFILPSKIEGEFEQTMRGAEKDYQVTRKLAETWEFTNYQVNDNSALKWFSRQP